MKKLVILSGAGVSAESGIRTFRDSDGLWDNYNVEDVASIETGLPNCKQITAPATKGMEQFIEILKTL